MDEHQRKQVADQVRAARLERGWSQNRLAKEAGGISDNTVLSIEKARHEPQPEKLRAVLEALGLAPIHDSGQIDLDGIPEDVRVFVRVALKRLAALDESSRAALLEDIWNLMLGLD